MNIQYLMENHNPNTEVRVCPKIGAPNKPGPKSSGKRTKGLLEGTKKRKYTKKTRAGTPMNVPDMVDFSAEGNVGKKDRKQVLCNGRCQVSNGAVDYNNCNKFN